MSVDRMKIRDLKVSGFKSIATADGFLEFNDINILLGANGSGKSNLFGVFKLLNYLTTGGLAKFVGKSGGASALLHYGPKKTPAINLDIRFSSDTNTKTSRYSLQLEYADPDELVITKEVASYQRDDVSEPYHFELPVGGRESQLKADDGSTTNVLHNLLSRVRAYQFHDTSATANIRLNGYIGNARYLMSDGGNLASFLLNLKRTERFRPYYDRICRHIRLHMPQFKDFELEPLPGKEENVRLNWFDLQNDHLFGPHQISDGSLRFMALCTLLLQPAETMPAVIVIDEPELGLHPSAIFDLANMIRMASEHCQVIVATQSPLLVNEFEVEQLIIVEWDQRDFSTGFRRLDAEELSDWLEDYCLADLWEKNVLGGYP